MKIIEVCNLIKKNHKEFIVFLKYGNFYKVYYDDAYIIGHLTGYKIVDEARVGFPVSSLNKILRKVEVLNISYIIYNKNNDYYMIESKYNNYLTILNEAKKNYFDKKRIEILVDKFRKLISSNIDELEDYERKI